MHIPNGEAEVKAFASFVFWAFVILVVPGGILAYILWKRFKKPPQPAVQIPPTPGAPS